MSSVIPGSRVITRKIIFDIWKNCKTEAYIEKISTYILDCFEVIDCDEKHLRQLQMYISGLCNKIQEKWNKSNRDLVKFLNKNRQWIEGEFMLPPEFLKYIPSSSSRSNETKTSVGRPRKNFEECTIKVRKRKVKDLLEERTPSELALAAEVSTRASGKRDAANLIKEITNSSPQRATAIKKARRVFDSQPRKMTPAEALALLVNAKLSTYQYRTIRNQAKMLGQSMYPPYYLIKEEKKNCYPPEDAILVTDVSAEINLQELLDLTIKRLFIVQNEAFDHLLTDSVPQSFTLICKWGCDGSSKQSRYKQKLESSNYSDEHLFVISFVPLRLVMNKNEDSIVVWQNPRPSSTRYCRMIRFIYQKETKDLIKLETQLMQNKINNLRPTKIRLNNMAFEVSHKMLLTMVDGKVCSALSQYSSSQTCYICGATPKEMNNEKILSGKTPIQEMYTFGISPLHSWIRSLEFILHLSYKLEIKKWQAKSSEDKIAVDKRKRDIQERFWNEMGLLVDMPKQSTGNTNDGNTARRFFRNTTQTAAITNINEQLLHHFRVLLEALSSGFEINSVRFAEYANETKEIFMKEYSWYYMPASIHKILVHAKDIIDSCILPLGQLSEEAQEARNKDYRQYRESFTRKSSRMDTNRDILNRFLLSSDPILSSCHTSLPKRAHKLPDDTIHLLKCSEMAFSHSSDSSSDEDPNSCESDQI